LAKYRRAVDVPLHKSRDSMIFRRLYSILLLVKRTNKQESSGKATAILVSAIGLLFVWSIVWANLPSKDVLLSGAPSPEAAVAPAVPELDLTIPGVPPSQQSRGARSGNTRAGQPDGSGGKTMPLISSNSGARQIVEMKCDAEVQQVCPDALTEEARRRCVAERVKRLSRPCQENMQQRIVRWREAEGYLLACVDDIKRVCSDVEPGAGRTLACLQTHEQNLSDGCYQRLPKGHLLLRN
jgi:Cysteine rich repeat